jgi:hypothetical protein
LILTGHNHDSRYLRKDLSDSIALAGSTLTLQNVEIAGVLGSNDNIGIGMSPLSKNAGFTGFALSLSRAGNFGTWVSAYNGNDGTNASVGYRANNGIGDANLYLSRPTDSTFILATSEGCSGGINVLARGNTGPVRIGTNNTERMRITPAGNVGIGTSTPTDKLEISGTTRSTTFIGNGIIPIGGIIMWSGTIASIPSGWALCNGSNSTPDLRDKFVIGAGVDSTGAKTNITGTPTQTGGTKDATLVSHSHFIANADNNTGEAAFATLSAANTLSREGGRGSGSDLMYSLAGSTPAAAVGKTNTVGTNGTNANLPPYYALAFIMRIA